MLRDISLKSKIKEWSFSEVRCAISQSLLWHPRKPDWPYTTHPRKPDWIPIVRVLNSLVNICKTLAVNGIHTNNPVKNIPTFGALLNLFSYYKIIVLSLVHTEMGMNLLPVQKQKKTYLHEVSFTAKCFLADGNLLSDWNWKRRCPFWGVTEDNIRRSGGGVLGVWTPSWKFKLRN